MTTAVWRIATPSGAGAIHLIRFHVFDSVPSRVQRIHTFHPPFQTLQAQRSVKPRPLRAGSDHWARVAPTPTNKLQKNSQKIKFVALQSSGIGWWIENQMTTEGSMIG